MTTTLHAIPISDLVDHDTSTLEPDCARPEARPATHGGGVIGRRLVHHFLDGREHTSWPAGQALAALPAPPYPPGWRWGMAGVRQGDVVTVMHVAARASRTAIERDQGELSAGRSGLVRSGWRLVASRVDQGLMINSTKITWGVIP